MFIRATSFDGMFPLCCLGLMAASALHDTQHEMQKYR